MLAAPPPHSRSTSYAPAVLTSSRPHFRWRISSWTAAAGARCRVFPPRARRLSSGMVATTSASERRLSAIESSGGGSPDIVPRNQPHPPAPSPARRGGDGGHLLPLSAPV